MVKLPPSKEPIIGTEFNFILVIVDRLIKWGTFIYYKESLTTENLVYTFFKLIVAEHALPRELISDKDKLFISRFWRELMAQLNIKYKLFIAYYPQTDG